MCLQVVEDLQTSLPTQFVQQIFSVDSPLLQLRYTSSPKVSTLCTLLIPSFFPSIFHSVNQPVSLLSCFHNRPLSFLCCFPISLSLLPFFSSVFLFLSPLLLPLSLSLSLPLLSSSFCPLLPSAFLSLSPPLFHPPLSLLLLSFLCPLSSFPSITRFYPSW